MHQRHFLIDSYKNLNVRCLRRHINRRIQVRNCFFTQNYFFPFNFNWNKDVQFSLFLMQSILTFFFLARYHNLDKAIDIWSLFQFSQSLKSHAARRAFWLKLGCPCYPIALYCWLRLLHWLRRRSDVFEHCTWQNLCRLCVETKRRCNCTQ